MFKINPVTNLLILTLFIIIVIITHSIKGYLILLSYLVVIIYLKKTNLNQILKITIGIGLFNLILLLYNSFYIKQGIIIIQIYLYSIHLQAIIISLNIFIQMFLIAIMSFVILNALKLSELYIGIIYILKPLKLIHVNVQQLALTIIIALNLIPSIDKEFTNLINAQANRGNYISKYQYLKKFKLAVICIMPLLIDSIHRANELAIALDMRKFDATKSRSTFLEIKFKFADILVLCSIIIIFYITI